MRTPFASLCAVPYRRLSPEFHIRPLRGHLLPGRRYAPAELNSSINPNLVSKKSSRGRTFLYLLCVQQFFDAAGDGAFCLIGTRSVVAIDLGFTVEAFHRHGAAAVQAAAVAADEFFQFHFLFLRDAEASGAQRQPIRRHHLQVIAQQELAGGDVPAVAAAVAVDLHGLAVIGSGEAQVLVAGLEECVSCIRDDQYEELDKRLALFNRDYYNK